MVVSLAASGYVYKSEMFFCFFILAHTSDADSPHSNELLGLKSELSELKSIARFNLYPLLWFAEPDRYWIFKADSDTNIIVIKSQNDAFFNINT